MLVAQVELILRLYEEALPGLLCAFLDCLSDAVGHEHLDEVYAAIPTSDFSRDVLARSVRHLSVVQVPRCGWSDLGTPQRLRTFGISAPGEVHVGTAFGRGTGSVDLADSVIPAPRPTGSRRAPPPGQVLRPEAGAR